jgi:hypothetical protein
MRRLVSVTMLTLNRLPRRQGAEMIAHVTGGKALPKEIADLKSAGEYVGPTVFPGPNARPLVMIADKPISQRA